MCSGGAWFRLYGRPVEHQYLPRASADTLCQLPIRKRRPLLWFAAIQGVERKQDLASLAPEGCFIAAQAIEREVGQIGQAQKTTGEFNGKIEPRSDRI
jgi:hypothetical protein